MKKYWQKPFFWAIIIFAAASFFRIFYLDLIEFKYDEAFTVFELTQFYAHPYLMQVGPPQSTGIYNPPLFNYLMVILSLFSRDPQYLSFVIGLVNSVFIVIFYLVIRKPFGNLVAAFSSLLLALSPWSIIFSRKIWIPDLILPFVVMFLYFYLKRSVLPLFLIIALLIQMHASGLFLALATVLGFLLTKEKINLKKAALGLLIGFIPAVPYFVRQLSSTPICIDCVAFFNYQFSTRIFDFDNFTRVLQLNNGLHFNALLGNDYQEFLGSSPVLRIINSLFLALTLIPLGGAIYVIRSKRQYLYLILFLVITPLLYFLSRTPSYIHYFAILIPLGALMYGLSFNFFWERVKNSYLKYIVIFISASLIILNVFFTVSFYKFVAERKVIAGDYGPVFPKTREFVEKETLDYRLFSEYPLIKSYAYMFAKPELIHGKLGELFMQGNNANLAIGEFRKALEENPKDTFSRGNLAYIYKMTGKDKEAEIELEELAKVDATMSAKLKTMIESARNKIND